MLQDFAIADFGLKIDGGKTMIELDDMKVMYSNQERYETENKEMLIAMLKDRDNLIERLWFELKATREQEQLWKNYAEKLESKNK